ncbi:hypothetical protein F5X68DRAFT_213179 [Plectosphaerella plurivora]|uniref:Uncharacterized protein n=1 Tax=Plectosphaerella plurivora TaxID=936078 RepID=A0A9P8V5Q0_9PEZI|nr:hypothetical protein F5X68DRAFT_213179 [Plectosphaerella plurivora]
MPPKVKAVKSRAKAQNAVEPGTPPAPFQKPPEVLQPFIDGLSPKHVYITHIDLKPVDFKRKIFIVPVAMNIAVVALFILRMYWIIPWYWKLIASSFGIQNELTFDTSSSDWATVGWEVAKRGLTLMFDFILVVFVWPWPVEFALGQAHGNPLRWRWKVGFREKEIYVRRSREWDRQLGDIFKEEDKKNGLLGLVKKATAPMLQHEKTGYLTMNGDWDLDWEAMVHAHSMVDKKDIAIDAFRAVVLVNHEDFGWMVLHQGTEDEKFDLKRRQVFEFRDALAAIGKEHLFFRWIEIVQFESTQPGGFGPERQVDAAKKIRDLFEKDGIDFDQFWKDSVGTDAFA